MLTQWKRILLLTALLTLFKFSLSLEADLLEGKKCLSNDDCDPPFQICNTDKNQCQHKNLFPMECTFN